MASDNCLKLQGEAVDLAKSLIDSGAWAGVRLATDRGEAFAISRNRVLLGRFRGALAQSQRAIEQAAPTGERPCEGSGSGSPSQTSSERQDHAPAGVTG